MQLLNGDCLELMKNIPDGSVDLVLTDPPYGTMKGIDDKHDWDEVIPIKKMFEEIARVLRPNGKCILFSQEPFTSNIITSAIAPLPFLYRAIWEKDTAGNCLMAKTAMVNKYEDINIFAKCGHDYLFKNPLREYFKKILIYIGLNSCKDVNKILGHRRAEHCFYVTGKNSVKSSVGGKADHVTRTGSTQFALCTESTYNELIDTFGIDKMEGFVHFSKLKAIQDKYIDSISATFNLWQGGKSKSNVLKYSKDQAHYHPTQKPILLLEDLIKTFSNEGETVLDFTMGSGSTGVACVNTNRDFIGIELDKGYYDIACERIKTSQA